MEDPVLELWNVSGTLGWQDADASADGTMPTRAFRYCEPMRLAAGCGIYLFAPGNFDLAWDGDRIIYRHFFGAESEWEPLTPSCKELPPDAIWNTLAPDDIKGQSPPLLTALREPGLIQFYLGVAARLPEDMRLWLRPPANVPRHAGLDFYEGVVRLSPARYLFVNARLTKTDEIISVRGVNPFIQAVPVPASMFAGSYPAKASTAPIPWEELCKGVQTVAYDRAPGEYAKGERRKLAETAS
jgi:hypothetical protein